MSSDESTCRVLFQLPNAETIPQTSEHLSSAYNTAASRSSTTGSNAAQSVTPSALDLNKQAETHSYSNQPSYNSYQPKSSSFQAQTYNSSSYSGTQVRKKVLYVVLNSYTMILCFKTLQRASLSMNVL